MKRNIHRIVSAVLFPLVFVVLFLVIGGTDHGATCWIGFGATLLSYTIIVAVPLLIPNSKSAYLFGLTSSTVTGIFFIVQFVIGLIFMISDFESWKIALVIEIIVIGISIFLLFQLLQFDEATAKKENNQQKEVDSIKKLVVKAQKIINQTTDSDMKRCVKNVCDELVSCPTASSPQAKTLDLLISRALDEMSEEVLSGDMNAVRRSAVSVTALIKERKAIVR